MTVVGENDSFFIGPRGETHVVKYIEGESLDDWADRYGSLVEEVWEGHLRGMGRFNTRPQETTHGDSTRRDSGIPRGT